MEQKNSSEVSEFLLLGLSQVKKVQLILFLIFVLFYSLILPGNILIILTIWRDRQLCAPMYFFLASLAFLDICYSSVTPPKMLADFLSQHKTISYGGCMCQLFFLHFLGAAEMFLLIAMAYDRYVAICRPLQYMSLVNRGMCCILVGASWAGGFVHAIILVILTHQLPFCGPNILDNFFCDVYQVIRLACTETHRVEVLTFINNGLIILTGFILLLISYAILLIRLRLSVTHGKSKASYTCVTHIIVVFVMFTPAIYLYTRPSEPLPLDKVVAVFHTVVFPLLNPVIYTMRNKEIKSSMKKLIKRYNF
ncbi:olfactory receptor 734-like [Sphaerodactylus townsendi]|uniref:olfactory receptor 734-like n=1 Tax=Sphaerodactylus townsendi TaxID=933632 RepID=UPI0020276450|nr:olfactory receptor 734-like [Sphaerodactylus townsendi]